MRADKAGAVEKVTPGVSVLPALRELLFLLEDH